MKTLVDALADAARIIRTAGGGARARRLRAEIDLLRSAIALDVGEDERAREAAAAMMD